MVKIADKIAYLGRDIEDAINLGLLDQTVQSKLLHMAQANDERVMNTTVIMHNLIIDICENSSPEKGICLSAKFNQQLNELKEFNYSNIYKHKQLVPYQHYSNLVIKEIFFYLSGLFDGKHTWDLLNENRHFTPLLIESFEKWLSRFCVPDIVPKGDLKTIALKCDNEKIYGNLDTPKIYHQAIIDFISGMTDRFAIQLFNELIEYK